MVNVTVFSCVINPMHPIYRVTHTTDSQFVVGVKACRLNRVSSSSHETTISAGSRQRGCTRRTDSSHGVHCILPQVYAL